MPLTKHLYREDEVAAALALSVQRGRVLEALFWCLELLDSGLANQLETALRTTWVLSFSWTAAGPAWKAVFEAELAKESLDPEAILELVAAAAAAAPTARPPASIRPLSAEAAAAVAQWRAATGPRARRAYTVPIDCLYWITERGRTVSVYDTNETELLGSLEKPTALWGSEYWDEVAETFGGWLAIKEDAAAREAFYEAHFPEDIPDEWSKADRGKSHGSGVLQRGATATCERWMQRWWVGKGPAPRAASTFEELVGQLGGTV
jgi:hypothetical protein